MTLLQNALPYFIHVGAFLYLVCFLFRDQILLRSFAIAGDFAYLAYYFTAANQPLWEAIIWSIPNIAVNLVMIALLLRDSRMTLLNDDELTLFQNMRGISPGQFRRLIKAGRWETLDQPMRLTEEGKSLDRLYYVLKGGISIEKAGRTFNVDPTVFIGELAYLRKKPATATAIAAPGSVLVSWSHAELGRVTAKDVGLGQSLGLLLSNDLAEKVARS
jgi:hypothetical protein